jgi:drug/metabolite transporter (DMT)-like permease
VGVGALGLVLAAAVLHAVWNLAAKRVGVDGVVFVHLYVLASAVLWAPVALVWVVWRGDQPRWTWLLAGAVTAAFHIAYQLVLQTGYDRGDLTVVYPLARGTGPLITFVAAVAVLGERPHALEVAGVLAVVAGVLVISLGGRRTGGRSMRAGVAWGAATGVAIAAYTLWDSVSVTDLAVPPLPYYVLGVVLQVPVMALLARRRPVGVREVWAQARTEVLAVALLSPLAYVLVLCAMQLAPVSLVAAARESSIVVGAVLGWWVLREPAAGRRLAGSVVVLAGIAAIVLG